jgi:hypothetical protein
MFIPIINLWAFDLPPGYEVVTQRANRIEIKDRLTGYTTPYLLSNDSIIYPEIASEDQIRPWYYFDTVAVLPWYAGALGADINHSGVAEIYGWANDTTYLDTLRNEWNFDAISLGPKGGPVYYGDTNHNGLIELLTSVDTILALYEGVLYNGYPSRMIWHYRDDCYCWLDAKIGDMDGDGLQEVDFYYGQRAYGYQMYEYTGAGNYTRKTAIRFWDHVRDYTGEPSWGDFDSDGRNEVVAGGIHGEIVMYECVADDSFEFVWEDSAGAPDAYSTEYLGDTDGDGKNEFMVAASSIWGGGGMAFSIYEPTGDNSFELSTRFGIARYPFSDGDIIVGDFTGNGYKEIALCTGYNITVIRAYGDNDWRQIARYRNDQRDLEISGYRINENYNSFLVNVVRVADSDWFSRILKLSGPFLPGDVNNDGHVSGSDINYLLGYIRGSIPALPHPFGRADLNGDCLINLTDISFLVNYFKGQGPAPQPGWCNFDLDQ